MNASDTQTEWQGIALVIVGAFCFSTALIFTRLADGMGVLSIAFYRALVGIVFLLLLTIRMREPLHVASYRESVRSLVALGVAVSLTVSLYTYAILNTTLATASLLVNSAPIYVAVLAPLMIKEPRARYTWASLGLAVIGIVCVSDPTQVELGSRSWGGLVAAALSGFTYAIALMIGRSLRGCVSGLTQAMWGVGLTALFLAPWALQPAAHTIARNLPVLIPLGVFSLGLSYLSYFLGLQRISAQVVSVVALFEPVSGVMIGLLLFGEIPNTLGVIGGILILVSIYLISR